MSDTDAEKQCKVCNEPIEGDVIMLHGRFPMHGDCYRSVVGASVGASESQSLDDFAEADAA